MHILAAFLYGLSVWLPYILYAAATHGSAWLAVALGPVIVSGAALFLIIIDAAIDRLIGWLEGNRNEPAERQ